MHIKSIVIDGFKSYKNRVEINDFHSQLNIITGDNSSGKSDILDAVAFVLCGANSANEEGTDTRNLLNRQDMGAAVTITLDNRDKSRSPAKYAAEDEIAIRRRLQHNGIDQWYINGESVPMNEVAEVCAFAHLDRPAGYLVTQTRILEVAGMTPSEILTLMRHTTGIHDFDNDKSSAVQGMTENESRRRELDEARPRMNVREDIAAAIATLDDQKTHACENACEKVNSTFGAILHSFIPGARARLAPQDGLTILDGLEVKVTINANLGEMPLSNLSGGEKAAAVISLLIAMFLVRPGPLYILDSVDEKLDHILLLKLPQILRNYLNDSQLIVISRQPSLVKIADVVFRMSVFCNRSAVERTASLSW